MTEQEAIKQFKERLSIEDYKENIPEYYEAMELAVKSLQEIQHYRELEQKLNGVDLTMLVNAFMEMAAEGEIQGYQRGRILTNEDADKWDEYLAIGTPEECRAAVEKQKDIRNKAIDDFKKEIKNLITDLNVIRYKDVDEIAEQLKEGDGD